MVAEGRGELVGVDGQMEVVWRWRWRWRRAGVRPAGVEGRGGVVSGGRGKRSRVAADDVRQEGDGFLKRFSWSVLRGRENIIF